VLFKGRKTEFGQGGTLTRGGPTKSVGREKKTCHTPRRGDAFSAKREGVSIDFRKKLNKLSNEKMKKTLGGWGGGQRERGFGKNAASRGISTTRGSMKKREENPAV